MFLVSLPCVASKRKIMNAAQKVSVALGASSVKSEDFSTSFRDWLLNGENGEETDVEKKLEALEALEETEGQNNEALEETDGENNEEESAAYPADLNKAFKNIPNPVETAKKQMDKFYALLKKVRATPSKPNAQNVVTQFWRVRTTLRGIAQSFDDKAKKKLIRTGAQQLRAQSNAATKAATKAAKLSKADLEAMEKKGKKIAGWDEKDI